MHPHLRMARAVVSAVAATGLFMAAACSASDGAHSATNVEKQQITDILGRNVEVPKKVERILMGGQRMLYTTAILNKENPLQGIVAWPDDLQQNDPGTYKKYQQRFSEIGDIKQTGEVYDGSMSVEQALESRPDVFIVSANSFDAARDAGIVDGLNKAGIEVDRAGRVPVNDDLTLGDYHNIFIVGDMMSKDRLPGVAQVAMQGGQYAATTILDEVNNGTSHEGRVPFNYFDKGSMAIVSRFNAVVKMNKAEVSGFFGWVMWLVLHLLYMVGFRNRAVAAFSWGLNSVSRRRWQLVATRQQLHARNALRKLRDLEDKEGIRSIEVRDNLRFGEGRDTRAVSD